MNTALAKQTDQSRQEQTPFERLLSHRDSLREATAHVRPLVEAIQRYSDERSKLHASHNSSVEHTTHPISNGASSVEISAVRAALENQRLSLMNDRSAMSERYTKILTSLQSTPVTPETVPT
jgi:nicotinamide mononucleotide adenylyltransferase